MTDLHGRAGRVRAMAAAIAARRPSAVFVGGDLFPRTGDFLVKEFAARFVELRDSLAGDYPRVFLILGNDDPRVEEEAVVAAGEGLWEYVHGRSVEWNGWRVFGYACVPPTPFLLKDWERYDVSRYVDPGCVSPEEGRRSVAVDPHEVRYGTIAADLDRLAGAAPVDRTIWLFHTPPYDTALDRAALDGRVIDHAPADVHVGSIAVRRFIERRQPPITLHGHIHESPRITGRWLDRLGETVMMTAAHDGPELALVSFDRDRPEHAQRELVSLG